MEFTYQSTMQLPASYAVLSEDEMVYTVEGANWQWRLDTPLTSLLAEHIADLTALYDRAPAAADR